MSDQYIRRASLVVAAGERGLDLSQLRFTFSITQADVETPNLAVIRIYNPTEQTSKQIRGEYTRVILNAGYQNGAYGVIFDGTIKQVKRGRLNALDTYVEIYAADGDLGFNFGLVNQTLAAGASPAAQANAIVKAFNPYGVTMGNNPLSSTGGILPRGKVLFGMARLQMRRLAASNLSSWSIQNGRVVILPLTGYLESQAIVLNSRSGMVGVPEATDAGILVTSLLNPKIVIGTRVQINNRDINEITVREQGFPSYNSLNFPASVTDDGFYRVLVSEHIGDTRGNEWYTNMVCLAVDPSVPPDQSVKAYG